jgi:hypothetical protein
MQFFAQKSTSGFPLCSFTTIPHDKFRVYPIVKPLLPL